MENIKKIPFSPPDITEEEINAVVEVLRSGWITTGPNLAKFEEELEEYCNVNNAFVVNSATAAVDVILKALDLKAGDEVITTPYTYTATATSALHRGAKVVFCDVAKDSFLIDYDKIGDLINENTKIIMPVDIAGVPCDYDRIKEILKEKNREDIIIMVDSAHSIGAKYKGKKLGSQCDFHSFSFHAVKNLTTAEGGALTFNDNNFRGKEDLKKELKITSLHGQSKDARTKMVAGAWEYDVINDGLKCNMTDISAAIGRVQLRRYDEMLKKRAAIFETYTKVLEKEDFSIIPFSKDDNGTETSYHLYLYRIKGFKEEDRNELIRRLAKKEIATNVHYKPLPMFTLYKNLGYKIEDYPNAYSQYENVISLPVYSTLSLEDAEYLAKEVVSEAKNILNQKNI